MTADSHLGATTRVTVDLGALEANYAILCDAAAPGCCGAVVKADAYGVGARPVVARLVRAGCETFFVATPAEGLAVREVAEHAEVFVFAGAEPDTADTLARARLIPMLNSRTQLEAWRDVGGPAAIQVDTGINRLGFPYTEIGPALLEGLDVVLLATHLACADQPDHPLNALQTERFASLQAQVPDVRTSIGNSAATLTGGARRGDLCRPGIALYGGNPFAEGRNPMRAVVTLEARVLQLRDLDPGDSVGYGATHTATRAATIATLGIGYADGLPRSVSNRGAVMFAGQRAPIVGRVSMDLTSVDVTGVVPRPNVGDWVEVLGAGIGVDECAAWADTIGYEILTGLGARAERRYVG